MELEILEHFQNDVNELNTLEEFLNMGRIIKNINCSKRFTNLCVSTKKRRRFNPMRDLTEEEFQKSYRFSKDNMKRLVEMVRDDLEIEQQHIVAAVEDKGRNQVPVDKQIMAAVRYWGKTEHPEITSQIHGITFRTLMKICKRVAEALSYKASRYIRMPCLLAEKEKVTKAFYDLSHMPQIIGAVNHTKIICKRLKRGSVQEPKPEDVLHIQIVSDANLKIRDLDCHLIKAAKDCTKTPSDIFAQSRIKERFEQNEFRGRLLLGDSSLKCSPYLYTPVSCAVTMAEQAFNSSLRLAYEPARQCLNLLKQRFGILNEDEFYGSPTTVRHVIVALIVLHNMAVEWEDTSIGANGLADENNILYQETIKSTDERSRAEFIKNHFHSFIH